jgi:hypothetical protein
MSASAAQTKASSNGNDAAPTEPKQTLAEAIAYEEGSRRRRRRSAARKRTDSASSTSSFCRCFVVRSPPASSSRPGS